MLKFVALLLKCSVKSGKTFSLFYLNKGYEGRNYQPYVATTLPGSGRDSNTGDCGASLQIFNKYFFLFFSSLHCMIMIHLKVHQIPIHH